MLKTREICLGVSPDQVARELVRALRGRLSCAEVSRRLGYRSNTVRHWESGRSWPTAGRFLLAHQILRPRAQNPFEIYFGRRLPWLKGKSVPFSEQVAAFLRDINGKVPVSKLAEVAGYNRYSTARWLSGDVEPKLPEFLSLVEAATNRLADFVATLVEPDRLPSLAKTWGRLQLARAAAYERPWSHAVLRALELVSLPRGKTRQTVWLAQTLGLSVPEVKDCLELLEATGQVRRLRGSYCLGEPLTIETGRDTLRGRALKLSWTRTALGRLESGSKDHFGYSLFAVAHADLVKIRELHLGYVRAMQRLIAQSENPECVGLYCSQLLDLSSEMPTS